jgi:hypothetical protein
MKRGTGLLIFDRALNLYKHLGLPDDCIDHDIEFSILNLGNFPIEVPYTSPSCRANFYSFVFLKKTNLPISATILKRIPIPLLPAIGN